MCTIPEVADCHQRANETSDQMVCSLKYVWMIKKLGGSILLGRGIKCMEEEGGKYARCLVVLCPDPFFLKGVCI